MNACNRILGIPRVASRVVATRSGVRTKSRVMATSYTEIRCAVLFFNTCMPLARTLRHVNVLRLTYLKNQRFFDKLRAVPEGFGL